MRIPTYLRMKHQTKDEGFASSQYLFKFCLLILGCVAAAIGLSIAAASPVTNREQSAQGTMGGETVGNNKTLYLNIIWHQHQPLYLDPASDQLQGPWVRTHGTKDYYDMVSLVHRYPAVHFTVNLTSSLMVQLEEYYVERLKPCVDLRKNRVDAKKYFATVGGKTDPWIDLALKPTNKFNNRDLEFLLTNVWNAFSVSDVIIGRFPEYQALREKFRQSGVKALSVQELREIKFWFYLANFDPDFLEQKVKLASGSTIDLTDLTEKLPDGNYKLRKIVSEDDCNRIIAETYKVLAAIIPAHRKLMYRPSSHKGQVEIITTPFYHPILPLIYDSDVARVCQSKDPMPARFHFPEDAEAQVVKAIVYFKKLFRVSPTGMWPAEGAVAHDVAPVFAKHGIKWIATDEKILARSRVKNTAKYYPYALSGEGAKDAVAIVFRDTELSDKIGFTYQSYKGEDAANDFIQSILQYAPAKDEPDRLLTVILDGENAWEWYRLDNDGKEFQNALYRNLSELYETRTVVTTTVTEYIEGNPSRGISPHPIESMVRLAWLWPGSWINANYDTWIGDDEENRAWDYLVTARTDLARSGLKAPDPKAPMPRKGTRAWYGVKAWESMYAAEGSDWFWWYGTDQSAPGGDKPFDVAFITYLENIYRFARLAKAKMPKREFKPINQQLDQPNVAQGTMAQSQADLVTVVFQVDCRDMYVRKSVYIAGSHELLGNWVPNKVKMNDSGTNGDLTPNDSIWTLKVSLPAGLEVEYKYTNSGAEGSWSPGEEFSASNRKLKVNVEPGTHQIVSDRFGKM
ncbi:MAG: glycoside hydrolase, family 57 [Bacteroidetes bacterium]|nr:glycoside hydrolase, family 57 [Bacteroidota bacterium]